MLWELSGRKLLRKTRSSSGYRSKILFSGFGGRKAPNSMGKVSTLGVLRLRAIKRCVTR